MNRRREQFRDRAPEILRERFEAMMRHEQGTRAGEDPEALHDMRVASRRLRAAVEAFSVCYRGKEWARVVRQTKELTGALGAARDSDVLIGWIEAYARSVPPDELPAIEVFAEKLRAERETHRAELVVYLDALVATGYTEQFPRVVAATHC